LPGLSDVKDDIDTGTVSGEVVTWVGTEWDGRIITGAPSYYTLVQNLGVARRSGTFDIVAAGPTFQASQIVPIFQTAGAITAKGNAHDEPEMTAISIVAYAINTTDLRCYWHTVSEDIYVGDAEFAYENMHVTFS
jgi:hypothetical protein